jgi:hypothetical protein
MRQRIEHHRQSDSALDGKDVSMAQLSRICKERVMGDADLEPKSKEARQDALRRLSRTWPGGQPCRPEM